MRLSFNLLLTILISVLVPLSLHAQFKFANVLLLTMSYFRASVSEKAKFPFPDGETTHGLNLKQRANGTSGLSIYWPNLFH